MIEGLHYDGPSEKVRDILTKRIEQCDKKAEIYQKQGEQQKALSAQIADDAGADSPKFSGDQSTNLLARAKEYQEKAKMFRFLTEHLIKDTYRLNDYDLRFLGIIDRNTY